MTTASSLQVRRSRRRRRAASTNARLALSICVAFLGLIAAGLFWTGQVVNAPSASAASTPGGLTVLNRADRFSETQVGQLLYRPEVGSECRRVLYDNRTSMLQEAGKVACPDIQSQPEPPAESDRMTALRKAFQK